MEDIVEGGPFTRFDPNDPQNDSKKSLLDIVVVSNELGKYIGKLEIDKNQQWTPYKVEKDKLKFPDHYAVKITLQNIPIRRKQFQPGGRETKWNLKRENGWGNYLKKTENNPTLWKAAQMITDEPEDILKVIEKETNKVKHASFGKITFSSRTKTNKKLDELQIKKDKIIKETPKENQAAELEAINNDIVNTLKDIQKAQFEKKIQSLQKLKLCKGKASAVFNLKERILGSKKSHQEPVVLVDPETKSEVFHPQDIKRVTLNYCVNLLKNKEPKEEYKEIVRFKERVHLERMEEIIDDDIEELSLESFSNTVENLQKKTGDK